jgi:archaetidylinositol phosphate synthase
MRDFEQRLLDPLVTKLKSYNPNTLTFLSLITGFLGGIFLLFPDYFLLIASFFIILSSVLDLLDGNLARKYDKHTKRGDFLDWVVDRYVDFFLIMGITYSGYVTYREVGLLAIIGIFLVSFIGSRVEFGGVKPIAGGILSRADRMVPLIIFPIIQYFLLQTMETPKFFGLWLFDFLLIYFAISSHLTALYRAILGWGLLRKMDMQNKN